MQPVQRKKPKSFNKKAKITIIMLLAAFLAFFIYISKPSQKKPESSDETVFTLLSTEKKDILSISIKPENGTEYSIMQNANGEYALNGDNEFLFDKETVDSIFDTACFWEAHYKIKENPSEKELSEFGVSNNSLMVSVNTSNNKYIYVFGDTIDAERHMQYIYAQQDNTLYVTKINYTDIYNFTLNELHTVPAVNFSPDLVDKITISKGNEKLIIERQEDLWSFKSPVQYPISKSSGEQLSDKIKNMRLAAFEAPKNKYNINKYGLNNPKAKITFDIANSIIASPEGKTMDVPAHKVEFVIGNSIENIGFYCLYEDSIYKATNLSMGFLLDIHIDDMLLTNPVNISIDRLKSVILKHNGKKAEYILQFTENVLPNNEIEKDSLGNTVYNMYVTKNGVKENEQDFITLYTELTNMQVEGKLPNSFVKPKGKAIAAINIKYDCGERTIEFYPFDTLHLAVSIDGVFMHYISADKLNLLHL